MLRRFLWVGVISLFAASLLTVTSASAQVTLGVKGGLNIADVGGGDAPSTGETKTGFIGGGFLELQFGNIFAVQPEVLYTMKGIENFSGTPDSEIKLSYIEVPVLLKVNVPIEGSNIRPNFYAGPVVAFEGSCKVTDPGTSVDDEDCDAAAAAPAFDDEPFETVSTDFGLVFGGGLDFLIGGAEVGADVRYTLGLTTIDDADDPDDIKNQVISFMVTVGFPLNR
jgi:hypothetical protein